MSLLKYLLTEGKKDVMINKIGLPESIVDEIVKRYDKRFMIYWANVYKAYIDSDGDISINALKSAFRSHSLTSALMRLEALLKNSRTPTLPNELKRIFKLNSDKMMKELSEYLDNNFTVHLYSLINELGDMYKEIADYGSATNQNFQNDDLKEIYADAVNWHYQIQQGATGKALQIEEGQVIIKQYDNGYYWLDLRDNNCQLEGGSMGHCGNTSADTLLSLRDEKGEPHVTVAYDYNNVYRQMKGKGNKKPVEKYHEYIVDLFIEENQVDTDDSRHDYVIKEYDDEYDSENDFNIFDLDDNLFEKVTDHLHEESFLELAYGIDYKTLMEQIDYHKSIIIIPNRRVWVELIEYKTADLYERIKLSNEDGKFIDALIKYDHLGDEYKNLKYYSMSAYSITHADNKVDLLRAIYNKEKLYLIRLLTTIYDFDIFYKK